MAAGGGRSAGKRQCLLTGGVSFRGEDKLLMRGAVAAEGLRTH